MADVTHRAPVHEQVPAGDVAVAVQPRLVESHGVAVLAQKDALAVDAHGLGQLHVIGHVPVLPVDGDEELGAGHGHEHGQLAAAGVAAHVDSLDTRVDDLDAAPVQAVDHPAHRPLVTGDGMGADHDHVARPAG